MKNYLQNISLRFPFILSVYAVIALTMLAAYFVPVYAQNTPTMDTTADIGAPRITLTPENPKPGETVSASVTSYQVDLSTAAITWLIDEKIIGQGTGRTAVSFTADTIGSASRLRAIITPQEGNPITASTLIRPSLLAIQWEAETYTPPLYRGKALQGPGAVVRFVAVPYLRYEDGTVADPTTLIYEWNLNEQPLAKQSGSGKQVLRVKNTKFFAPLNISVSVHSPDDKLFADARVTVPVTEASARLYELHPRYGTWYTQALGNSFTIRGRELNLLVEPYYYSVTSRTDKDLAYLWQVNGRDIDAREVLTLRPVGEGEGVSRLTFSLRNTNTIPQTNTRTISVLFSAEPSASADSTDAYAF